MILSEARPPLPPLNDDRSAADVPRLWFGGNGDLPQLLPPCSAEVRSWQQETLFQSSVFFLKETPRGTPAS